MGCIWAKSAWNVRELAQPPSVCGPRKKLLPPRQRWRICPGITVGREAALALYEKIRADKRFISTFAPELDIIIWAPRAASVSAASEMARKLFVETEQRHLYLALANLPLNFLICRSACSATSDTITLPALGADETGTP